MGKADRRQAQGAGGEPFRGRQRFAHRLACIEVRTGLEAVSPNLHSARNQNVLLGSRGAAFDESVPARCVTASIGSKAPERQRKDGESRSSTCGSGELSCLTRNSNASSSGSPEYGEPIRINDGILCLDLRNVCCLPAMSAGAETPKAANPESVASYTTTTANVSGAPDAIRIDIPRWSTDAERDKLMDAWNLRTGNPARGGSGRGGRGDAAATSASRGAAGRGGRGGGEGTAAPSLPEAMLATALKEAATVGYLWSREVAGYALRYAGRTVNADGSERIVLITQRRLGAVNDLWKPAVGNPPDYDFSVIELRLKGNGSGEGKTSLNGKVAPDSFLKIVTIENYDTLPVVFSNVQPRAGKQ